MASRASYYERGELPAEKIGRMGDYELLMYWGHGGSVPTGRTYWRLKALLNELRKERVVVRHTAKTTWIGPKRKPAKAA